MKNTFANHTRKLLALLAIATAALTLPLRAADGPTNHAPALVPARPPGPTMVQTGVWKEPDKVLPDVKYEGLPIQEVGEVLRRSFDGQFDVLLPQTWNAASFDWQNTQVTLQLKNVKASEIFNSMNLMFESAQTPLRWELLMNGHRQTALLHVLYDSIPRSIDPATGLPVSPAVGANRKTTVFGISGPLYASGLGNYKQAAASLAEALEAVLDDISDKPRRGANGEIREGVPVIKIHAEAAILVFTGTAEETDLIHSTLGALNDGILHKAEVLEKEQKKQKANIDGAPKSSYDDAAPKIRTGG